MSEQSPSELLRLYLGQIDHRVGALEQRVRDVDRRMDSKVDEIEAQVGELSTHVATYGEQIKTLFRRGTGVVAISSGTIIAIIEAVKYFAG